MLRFAVVIPALNEAAHVAAAVRSAFAAGAAHVVVADGGSTDGTAREAWHTGAEVVVVPPGRAAQMNAGAGMAKGEAFVFLHADTRLPPDAGAILTRAFADPAVEATLFRLAFDRDTPLLRFYAACTAMPAPHIAFGDRALSVRRSAFEAVGGFPEIPAFEDLELARRLHRRGGLRFLDATVTTSARRFTRNGALRQQARNLALWTGYLLGVPPEKLARHYRYGSERG